MTRGFWHRAIFALVFLAIGVTATQSNLGVDDALRERLYGSCYDKACFPMGGDLLIGRMDRFAVSSTCGTKGPESYCVISRPDKKKECFVCDASSPENQHNIENATDGSEDSWWQSENGVEEVFMQLDLEAIFRVRSIIMKFKSVRPAAMLIERSNDFGKTWNVYRYFAYNCEESFPGIPMGETRSTDVICETLLSGPEPFTGGLVGFHPVRSFDDEKDSPTLTNLRINMTKFHTFGEELSDENRENYYYAIEHLFVLGVCHCNGHASNCLPVPGVTYTDRMRNGKCSCMHNTAGLNCEKCAEDANDVPWRPGVGEHENRCERCNCNGHALSCHFDPELYEKSGRVSGGVCDNCQHNTQGRHCEECMPFYYRDPDRAIYDPKTCLPCNCDPVGAYDNSCDVVTGQCRCKPYTNGRRCNEQLLS